ncbi:hypothetical protein JL100_015005 [Skermanella mucosa]|uniref:hypothetical protein n=1 Tax=Skermanella mucosa TaxID=1789672 RepID=UPI00192B1693|nr:hypothetical protein [Skermanella mucosa]UEM18438.1 hypothetical protein JL100_015005 [Skermanella mucosa]
MPISGDRVVVGDFGSGLAPSDDQHRLLEPVIPLPKRGAWSRTANMAHVEGFLFRHANRLLMAPLLATCGPSAVATVDDYMRAFPRTNMSQSMYYQLLVMLREQEGREAGLIPATIYTQIVKTTKRGEAGQ